MITRLTALAAGPHRLVAAALAAGTLLVGLPAVADGADTAGVAVHYAPAALETEAGARAVYSKINRAARRACGQPDSRALSRVQEVQECRRQAVSRAVTQIGSPMLATVHATKSASPRLAAAGDIRASR